MDLRTGLKRRLRDSRNWLEVLDELEKEAEQGKTDQEKSDRYFGVAEVCEEVFLNKQRALQNYQRAFKLNVKNVQALQRARRIYRETGNLELVAKLLEFELKVTADPNGQAVLQGELGRVRMDLRKKDQAMPHLLAAANVRPDDPAVADTLAAALAHAGNWLQEAERLAAEAGGVDSASAARILMKVARILALEVPDD